jgi:type VI secretion system secreted protein VgrG
VTGAMTVGVGGSWIEVGGVSSATGVLGVSNLTSAGPLVISGSNVSINATTLSESYGGAYKLTTGGKFAAKSAAIALKAGGAVSAKGSVVVFKASSKITIKAGGVTISITPGSITVKGKLKTDTDSVATTQEKIP